MPPPYTSHRHETANGEIRIATESKVALTALPEDYQMRVMQGTNKLPSTGVGTGLGSFAHLTDHKHVHAVQLDPEDVVSHRVVRRVRRRALL